MQCDIAPVVTRYINTDLVLASRRPINLLCDEFERTCCVLYHQQEAEGDWRATIESDAIDNVSAENDIQKMLSVVATFSAAAIQQWDNCYIRDINIGFDCGETWAYSHSLPDNIVRLVADVGCSLSVTLYPIRRDNGPTS